MSEFLFKGKKVYYELHGEGEPILVLNGIMMSTESWNAFKPSFSKDNLLILVDFFDQGRSDRLDFEYKHDLQVDLLKALLEHIKIDRVNVVGISYGSAVALQFVLKYPRCVRRLCLFNGAARTSSWLTEIGWAWNEAAKLGSGRDYYYTTIPPVYSTYFYERRLDWMKNRAKKLIPYFDRKDVQESLIRLTNSSEGYDVSDRLGEVECPTPIVNATDDVLIPLVEQTRLHEGIKNSEMVIIPKCGHASMYEKPMLFSSLVLGWINVKDEDYESIFA